MKDDLNPFIKDTKCPPFDKTIIHQIFMINHKNVNSLVDIDQLQTTCKKKSLDGSFVTIHPVFVTNCIIVRGYSENITEDKLEWYFENKKKSGVEGVTEIKRDKEEGYCIKYFQNSKGEVHFVKIFL